MSDIRKLLDIIQETTVAGSVATVAAPLGSTQKRNSGVYSEENTNESDCDDSKETKSPREFGLWKNSALIAGEQKRKRQEKKEQVKESEEVKEVAAPSQEEWIKKNKKRFVDQYGKEKGERVLYATAWKRSKQDESTIREYDEGITSKNPVGIPESKDEDAFDKGWRTWFRRGSENDNPYEKDTPEYKEWLDGYLEGQAQRDHYNESVQKKTTKILEGITSSERNEMDTPEFQSALASLKKKASQGPMKTVFDPKTRKYKVVPVNDEKKDVAEDSDIGYHPVSGTKAGHTVSSKKLSNKPQASKSDVTLQSGSMHHRGKSYNFPKGTLFTQLPGGIFAKHPDVPETHPGYGHLIKSSVDNIQQIHNALNGEQGVAEGSLVEMDKSAPQPGRDGRVSHSTYGSRDKGGSKGPEKEAKPITARKAKQDALDILKKQGVAEASMGSLMAADKIKKDKEDSTRRAEQGNAEIDARKSEEFKKRQERDAAWWKAQDDAGKAGKDTFDFDGKTYPLRGKGVAEGSVNDYFKRRKDEEDRIAGIKAPAKRTPGQTDYAKRRAQEKKVDQGVAEGSFGSGYGSVFTLYVNTGEKPATKTKTKKFKREDDAVLWAEDYADQHEMFPNLKMEIQDENGNVVWELEESQGVAEGFFGDKVGKEINYDAIGRLSDEELQKAYKFSSAAFNSLDPEFRATAKALRNEIKKRKSSVAEARPDVMRHRGDTTIRVVKRAGKPIGEIGIDAEASPGNGSYYVKLYDGSYDAVGFDSPEEALAELKYAIKQSMTEATEKQYNKFRVGQKVIFTRSTGQKIPSIVTAVDFDDEAVEIKSADNKPFPNSGGDLTMVVDPGWQFLTPVMGVNYDSLVPATSLAEDQQELEEAEYRGRTVTLNKPMQGDVKKFKVYVKDPKTGNVKKVNFGDPNMRIKKSNPARRKSFRARHNCANPGPKTKARYWSCRKW